MSERITAAELARQCGKTPQAITAAVKVGRIKRGADGKFDRDKAVAAMGVNMKPAGPGRGGKQDEGDAADLLKWRTKSERETFWKRKLERQELQGRLIRRSVVERTWAEQATMVRDQLLQLGPRLAGRLAAETDPRVCSQLVTDEVTVALRALAEEV